MAVQISKDRFYSDVYWTAEKQKLGKPLVINIRSSFGDERKEAEKDVQRIRETLPGLGFSDPFILDSKDGGLDKKDCFLKKVVDIANTKDITINSDVFLCIIMAYGEENLIYTAGPDPEKVEISDVISIFKASSCAGLVCKPKIFIIHTDDRRLEMIKPENQSRHQGDIKLPRVPVEADILVYHSQMSAKYVRYIRVRKPKLYSKLMRTGLVETSKLYLRESDSGAKVTKDQTSTDNSKTQEAETDGLIAVKKERTSPIDNEDVNDKVESDDKNDEDGEEADSLASKNGDDDEEDMDEEEVTDEDESQDDKEDDDQFIGTHFIFTLCKTAETLVKDGCFDLSKWIFLTNKQLKKVMDAMKPKVKDGEWKRKPRLPLCTIQLTKKLVVHDLSTRVA